MTATVEKFQDSRNRTWWRGIVRDQLGQITDVIEMRKRRVLKKCLRACGALTISRNI